MNEIEATRRGKAGIGYFPAVDGLRAVAILSVLIYHLRPNLLPGGFVGVDIFFVISGFVVTASLVHRRFDTLGSLLGYFYRRRVVRIVPALLVMLAMTGLLSVLFIPPGGMLKVAADTAQAASFGGSNVLLALHDSDYFDPRQDLNPFLHTWTLGVEEQFYLLFPFFFFFCQRIVDDPKQSRRAVLAVAVVTACSLLAAWLIRASEPRLAFYLMPTRFWELGCGMLLCLTIIWWRPRVQILPPWAVAAGFGAAIVGLAAIFASEAGSPLPLRHLVGTVAATTVLIALVCGRPQARATRTLAQPALISIGKLSYSLYLWHWPVFVLFRWTIGLDTALHAISAVAIAFGCALASYRLVEQPIRRRGGTVPVPWVLLVGGLAMFVCAATVFVLYLASPRLTLSRSYPSALARTVYLGTDLPKGCPLREESRPLGGGRVQSWIPLCPHKDPDRRLMVIGDSHAYAMGISLRRYASESETAVHIYWKAACDFPSLSIPVSRKAYCADFYRAASEELLRDLTPGDTLLMASMHLPRIGRHQQAFNEADRAKHDRPTAYREALVAVRALADTGAELVLQAPQPVFRSPAFRCSDWFNRRNPVCDGGLSIGREESLALRGPALADMNRLAASVRGLRIWDPFPILCPRDPCTAIANGIPLYVDEDHVNAFGQRLLYPSFLRAVSPKEAPRAAAEGKRARQPLRLPAAPERLH